MCLDFVKRLRIFYAHGALHSLRFRLAKIFYVQHTHIQGEKGV